MTTVKTITGRFENHFKTEQDCRDFLSQLRWPDGKFVCPACGNTVGTRLSLRGLTQCASCHKQISLTAGTVFHGSRTPLLKLFRILWNIASGNSRSTAQTARELSMNYSTTWEWMERMRTLLETEFSWERQIQVHWSALKKVLFKRSIESETDNQSEANSNETKHQTEAQTGQAFLIEDRVADPFTDSTTLSSCILTTTSFLSNIFHGVSRKYAQKYSAELSFNIATVNGKFEMLASYCIRFGPITRTMILNYKSPAFISLPIPQNGV